MSFCTACGHDNHPQYSFCLKCAVELPLDPRREPISPPRAPIAAPTPYEEPAPEPALSADLTGLVINDRYELGEELGRDATSVFHRALHRKLEGAHLCVRVLAAPRDDRGAFDAFLAETKRLAAKRSIEISVGDVVTIDSLEHRPAMVLHTSEGISFADLMAFINA